MSNEKALMSKGAFFYIDYTYLRANLLILAFLPGVLVIT